MMVASLPFRLDEKVFPLAVRRGHDHLDHVQLPEAGEGIPGEDVPDVPMSLEENVVISVKVTHEGVPPAG
jgi:hypothetical protein